MRNARIVILVIAVLLTWTSLGAATPETIKLAVVTKPGSAHHITAQNLKLWLKKRLVMPGR